MVPALTTVHVHAPFTDELAASAFSPTAMRIPATTKATRLAFLNILTPSWWMPCLKLAAPSTFRSLPSPPSRQWLCRFEIDSVDRLAIGVVLLPCFATLATTISGSSFERTLASRVLFIPRANFQLCHRGPLSTPNRQASRRQDCAERYTKGRH